MYYALLLGKRKGQKILENAFKGIMKINRKNKSRH